MNRLLILYYFVVVFFFINTTPVTADQQSVQLHVNEGKFFALSSDISEILITNPQIADVQLTQDSGLLIYGKEVGTTHIIAVAPGNKILFNQHVSVRPNLTALKRVFAQKFDNSSVQIEWIADRLLLSGSVKNTDQMQRFVELAEGALQDNHKLVNNLNIAAAAQVNLKVRIMEMNRTETENIGINWDILFNPGTLAINLISGRAPLFSGDLVVPGPSLSSGGSSSSLRMSGDSASVGAVLDALVEQNLVTVLAEPNLTSRSGETASFFAGGEFPIPISAGDDQIRIEFKKFGVILDMTPTVLSDNRIRLHIKPEVSELTTVGAVRLNDIVIPGVAARRTEATIELASGQSFAVAGLLQNQRKDLLREVPWLSELDILGPLFKSREYQNSETELVVIATANIVKPLDQNLFRDPSSEHKFSSPAYIPDSKQMLHGPRGIIFPKEQ